MTLCPIAITAGCKKCPMVSVCPLKSVIGDFTSEEPGGSDHAGEHRDEESKGK